MNNFETSLSETGWNARKIFGLIPVVAVSLCWLHGVNAQESKGQSHAIEPTGRVVRDYDGWKTYWMSPARLTETHRTIFPARWSVADAQRNFLAADSTMVDDNAALWYLQAGGFFEQEAARESWNRFNVNESKQMMADGDYNPAPYRWLEVSPKVLPVDDVRKYTEIFSFQQRYLDRAFHCRRFGLERNARETEDPIHYPLPEIQSLRRRVLQTQRLRIRLAIAEGRIDDAITLAGQSLQFAHHLSHDPYAVVTSISEDCAKRSLTDTLYLISHPECPNLYDAFNRLPTPLIDTTDSNAFAGELFFHQVPVLRAVETQQSNAIDWAVLIDKALPMFGECKLKDAFRSGGRFAVALFIASTDQEVVTYLHQHVGMNVETIDSLTPPHRFFLAAIRFQMQLLTQQARSKRLAPDLAREQINSNLELVNEFSTLFNTVRWSLPNSGSQVVLPQHRTAQMIVMLQTIEVIRDHLARHGELPQSLEQTALPAPSDPITGHPVSYTLQKDQAILTSADNGFERQQIVLTAGESTREDPPPVKLDSLSPSSPVRLLARCLIPPQEVLEEMMNTTGGRDLGEAARQRIQALVKQLEGRGNNHGNNRIEQRFAINVQGETEAVSKISAEEELALSEVPPVGSDSQAFQLVVAVPSLIRNSISSALSKDEGEAKHESMENLVAATQWLTINVGLAAGEIDVTIKCVSADLARQTRSKVPQAIAQVFERLTGMPVDAELRQAFAMTSINVEESTIQLKCELTDQSDVGIAAGLSVIASALAKHDAAMNKSRMRRLMIAVHNYHSAYRRTPPFRNGDESTVHPGLSWRVAILPFLDDGKHMKLYQRFDLSQPWDSPTNLPLVDEMPAIFHATAYTAESVSLGRGETTIQSTSGAGGTMGIGGIEQFREVIDGLANTVFLVETDAEYAVEWTAPRDYDIQKNEIPSGLAVALGKTNVAFGDAWAGGVPAELTSELWRGLFTVAGKEPIYKEVRKIRQ